NVNELRLNKMSTYRLTIYTRPLCSDCQNLKKYLSNYHIPHQLFEVKTPEDEKNMVAVTGSKIVPGLVFKKRSLFQNRKVLIGFDANRNKIEQLVKQTS
ncbi:glutaredoxin domain-containing protein, partial [Lactococcus formosensis subsp. bovis]|uniref:glutaredoxin domain-containing protein n=3 Tax=Lactobacillales TaxID=186826 RepID=UPI0038523113